MPQKIEPAISGIREGGSQDARGGPVTMAKVPLPIPALVGQQVDWSRINQAL